MIRRFSILALCALLVSLCAQAAFAGRYDGFAYTADLPKGWKFGEEEAIVWAKSPKDATQHIEWLDYGLSAPDLERHVKAGVKDGQMKMLNPLSCIFVSKWGGDRVWIGVTPDGAFFSIRVPGPVAAVPAFLKSLTPKKGKAGADGYAELFKAANTKEVVDWLTFVSPDLPSIPAPKAEKRAETQTRPFTANGIRADVPVGWEIIAKGDNSVRFTAPGGPEKGFVLAYLQQLSEADNDNDYEAAWQAAEKLGGKNIRAPEGMTEFTLEHNRMGLIVPVGERKLLVTIYLEDDDASEELIRSVEAVSP